MARLVGRLALVVDALVIGSIMSIIGALFSRDHWFFDVLSQFLLPSIWMLVAGPILLIGLIIAGASARHGLFGAAALCGLVIGAPILHAPNPEAISGAPQLKIYQHNIYVENTVIDRIVDEVERDQPDILALVEVREDMIEPHVARLRQTWPHTAVARSPSQGKARLRLFSKYPITNYQVRKHDGEPATLRAELETPLGGLTVFVVHFTRPWPFRPPNEQMLQYEGLADMLAEESGPLLVLGDFNSAPWGRIGRAMEDDLGFQLANRRAVGTWPGRINIDDIMNTPGIPRFVAIPIDLAFCRGPIVCTGHEVGMNLGSDHRYATFLMSLAPQE
ncbi:endonuclease/exonuclease/phosphatase family protein [Henriciella sp. AS95]|uniref:endonuclease/exonuclease/phosphatase family protein n=1 Tax=Henriciella sp. AS95 TaxID=3135782 RepID=UPI00317F1A14